MSLDFKLHYDRLHENDPTKPETAATKAGTLYDGPSHARNLCLVWPDGKQQFLSYAYLVGGELTIGGEINVVTLNFSAYTVTLKGYCLEHMFHALLDHLPRSVAVMDKRYAESIAENQSAVTDILVVKNDR